ncbi:hypothetical protein ESY86_18325 [Subsaximicrobium wynnwilliamsii]|jgi:hypothetical protein|uniref:Uncharacterized protein n=1 Tax=Subsaximicrobium wynnwilliamsii TaxID=291179 RepID=A0A5C6ZC86_9FLAO|nr:hypothetical protein [Subsaximicrobium wynnwilliamsii]TXD81897.1 hypothetical protein ESY87_16235 [Subsaximicrobium wynnwilliamsii]TXD87016.1 hypothetical protein ESY86_18325 [Subsaximicrobium wynnwilliamsii]TXE01348.1 hypothetical protein ESY88_16225 [Subsaximicrobium wynnwilliamsii]
MKYLILFCFIASATSIICGLALEVSFAEKLVGFGTVGLFIITFPLFAYYRWKDRSLKDYMLNKENLDKMRDSQKESKY